MKQFYIPPEFDVIRDPRRCVNCKICVGAVSQRGSPLG